MSSNPAVAAAKRDLSYMLSVLGIQSSKTTESHAPCPFCGDATCLQFGPDKKHLGEWYWHCNKGCGNGNVVKAICRINGWNGDDDWKMAYDKIEKDFGGKVPKQSRHDQYHQQQAAEHNHRNGTALAHPNANGYIAGVVPGLARMQLPAPVEIKKQDPVLDLEKAEAFVQQHHGYLMRNFGLVKKWKRGLSEEVCKKYRIGFAEFGQVTFHQSKTPMPIPAAWILPITDENNDLRGVKAHFEERPYPDCPKLMWMPFGTEPAYKKVKSGDKWIETKPIHKYSTMWPHPLTLKPEVVSDFSLEAEYYIERIPPTLKPEWETILQAQQFKLAMEVGKIVEELEGPDLWTAQLRTFEEMKQKIFKAVIKTENALAVIEKNKRPETDWSQYIFICPGELKGLACESGGLMATAGTEGEGAIPGPNFLSKFTGRKVCLFGDNDPPHRSINKKTNDVIKIESTGKKWVEKWIAALEPYRPERIIVKYGGTREKDE